MQRPLLTDLLESVSRSFYLTLKVLPSCVRNQIGLAYLLARTSDTIADTEVVPAKDRIEALDLYQEAILNDDSGNIDLSHFAGNQGDESERELLHRANEGIQVLGSFDTADQQRIKKVFQIITEGQQLDLKRFDGASAKTPIALETSDELDDYTYRVAGCVGEFWTIICRAHAFPKTDIDEDRLLSDGIRFGKGLQLINILRDLPKDLAMGRCYMPQEQLEKLGLSPEGLSDSSNENTFRPYYESLIDQAEENLRHGWRYALSIPWSQARIRIACALPILIGNDTLKLLRQSPVLGTKKPIKIPRSMVKGHLAKSLLFYPLLPVWKRMAALP